MHVTINGEPTEVSDHLTVTTLLTERSVSQPDMVAVEVNGTILKREDFPTTVILAGDAIEFLYFMGGGTGRTGSKA